MEEDEEDGDTKVSIDFSIYFFPFKVSDVRSQTSALA